MATTTNTNTAPASPIEKNMLMVLNFQITSDYGVGQNIIARPLTKSILGVGWRVGFKITYGDIEILRVYLDGTGWFDFRSIGSNPERLGFLRAVKETHELIALMPAESAIAQTRRIYFRRKFEERPIKRVACFSDWLANRNQMARLNAMAGAA